MLKFPGAKSLVTVNSFNHQPLCTKKKITKSNGFILNTSPFLVFSSSPIVPIQIHVLFTLPGLWQQYPYWFPCSSVFSVSQSTQIALLSTVNHLVAFLATKLANAISITQHYRILPPLVFVLPDVLLFICMSWRAS